MNEPIPNGEIRKTAPASMSPEEKKIWRECLKKVPTGVLGDCDEYVLAMAMRLEWKERSGTIKISERAQYIQLLGSSRYDTCGSQQGCGAASRQDGR
jgi:hypothetical protein